MERSRKSWLGIMVAFMVIMMIAGLKMTPVYAEDNEAVVSAKEGIVQICVYYEADNGKEYSVQWGTGFFINETTILTCNHVVYVDDETITALRDTLKEKVANKSDKQIRDKMIVKATIQGDAGTVVKVNQDAGSNKGDYRVLETSQAMGYKPLSIRDSKDVKATEKCFAMGFPGKKVDIVGKKGTSFTTDDISIVESSVSDDPSTTDYKGTKIIMTNNTVTDGFSGGPLVDEEGNVIGIVFAGDYENKCYSVATDEFVNVLNRYGIQYDLVGSAEAAPETEPTQEPESDQNPEPITPPDDDPRPVDPSLPILPIIIGIVAAAAIIIAVIVLVMKASKKSKIDPVNTISGTGSTPAPAPAPMPPSAPVAPTTAPSVPAYGGGAETGVLNQGSGETTVLGQGSNETTVLSGAGAAARGTLIRNKNGERISINKDVFKIGRERSRVDYCISDNTAVGRHHATIISRNGESFIVDQNSRNFTFVNDVKSAPNVETKLNNGDKICLADEEFTYNC